MSFQLINVGIADLKVTQSPNVLRTILGSCVGVCLFDPETKVIGLSHIMLAEQNIAGTNPKKYADSAIPLLVEEMEAIGAVRSRLTAKIAGGAAMFNMGANSIMGDIGKSNIRKVKEILGSLSIDIIADDTGGDFGRTIDFFAEDFQLRIKSIGRDEKYL
ncbi:MAG TPA: chemotaxis protein CheD [Spirochaetota bacterium]